MNNISVAVVVADGFSSFHLSVPLTVFGDTVVENKLFSLRICSEHTGIIWSKEKTAINAEYPINGLSGNDVIVIPFWDEVSKAPPEILLDELRQANEKGRMIVGLCLGSFVLAWAGILDGHKAATHWEYEGIFQQLFPNVRLDINSLYIEDNNLITSAGSAAAIDCCLHIIRSHFGQKLASQLARRLVVAPHRSGGQAQFIEQKVKYHTNDTKINHLLDYLIQNLVEGHNIDALATYCAMSRRTLTRRFYKATGLSVGQWLATERLRRSQEFLENTNLSVERIAELAGFKSAITFRQIFRQKLGVSPREWRKNFHGQVLSDTE